MKRVLLVANNFPPIRGGSAVVYENLAQCAGDRMIVVAPRVNYADGLPIIGWREHDRGKPYRVVRLRLLRTKMNGVHPQGWKKLLFLALDSLLRLQIGIVLLWLVVSQRVRAICIGELLASSWIIRLFRLIPGVRIVAYVHGEEITTQDLYDPVHHRGRRALLGSHCIVVVSRFTQHAVAALLGQEKGGQLSLIENGVNGDRFQPKAKPRHLLDFYRLTGCFVFVSVCRLLEKKGVDHAIRAFAEVLRRHPDSRYVIVGTGPYQEALDALVKELGLVDQVVFAGQVADDELVEHYQLGDVFVMPNRELPNGDTEGFGLVFLEANSCGLPVIAGQDGGSTDAVRHGVNGLVVDGGSVEKIAEAMLRLREDAALRETLRRQGLAVAKRAGWAEKTRLFLTICLKRKGLVDSGNP